MRISVNWVDRLVGVFDPERALARMRARTIYSYYSGAGNYIGADRSRRPMRFVSPQGTSADAATLPQLEALRATSRDLVRNNPLAGGAVATTVTSVVGTGLSVQPQVNAALLGLTDAQAEAWQDSARAYFELWAEQPGWCDIAARLNFYQQTEVAFRSAQESGDCFALLPVQQLGDEPLRTKIQLIEADRVSNPGRAADTLQIAGGIKTDEAGRPLAVFVSDRHPGELLGGGVAMKWQEIAINGERTGRRNVLQIGELARPGQRRGVPYLAPIIEQLLQLGRYTEAEINAAVVSAMFTVFVKSEDGGGPTHTAVTPGQPQKDAELALGSGAILGLAAGEDVTFANPARPNASFDPFVLAILRQIGVRLELPFEVLVKHFTASYSAARAALLEAWRFFRKRRQTLAWQFCQPVYEAVITEAVSVGLLTAPGFFASPLRRAAWLRAVWIGDAPGAIDPAKEAQAAQTRYELGITTLDAESIAFDGVNWRDKHRQQLREAQARREGGLEQPREPARAAPAGRPPPAAQEDDN